MKPKIKVNKGMDCPYCKMGIPRQVLVPIFDLQTRKTFLWDVSEKIFNRVFKKEN